MDNTSQSGYVMIVLAIIFAALGLVLVLGGAIPVTSHYSSIQGYVYSKQSLLASNSGANEAIYRLKTGKNVPVTINISLDTGSSTVTTTATPGGKQITVSGLQKTYQRNFQIDLSYGDGISFHYGIQSGQGGFIMQNSSSVTGNVYSNGTVTGSGNYIYGDVVSAGPSGVINGVHATGTAYAHTIQNSTIDKDAYYDTITNTAVSGTRYPGSTDQDTVAMPISDEQISEWESAAAAGDTVTCTSGTYTINSDMSLGPKKIPCDLLIKGNGIALNVTGPIWVTGNITTQNGPIIKMDSGLGSQNVAIIADNPAAPTTQGLISIGQNTEFEGSGSAGSYVFVISGNTAAENNINTNAIDMGQSAGALVVYTNHGQISLGQSVNVKEATAYKIILSNTANVTYDTGLASALFKSGPAGGFSIVGWREN